MSSGKQLSGSSQWGLIDMLVIANYTKASDGFEKPPESTRLPQVVGPQCVYVPGIWVWFQLIKIMDLKSSKLDKLYSGHKIWAKSN